MAKRTKSMIRSRKADLKQLFSENATLTNEICRELDIEIVPDEPRCYAPPDPIMQPYKDEVRSVKMKKIKAFREELQESEAEFYLTKKDELKAIEENLNSINLGIEEVYEEVISDRQERAMLPIYDEKYRWFEREKQLKLYYEKLRSDKREAKERQQRR